MALRSKILGLIFMKSPKVLANLQAYLEGAVGV
jgi:hypothetical protein